MDFKLDYNIRKNLKKVFDQLGTIYVIRHYQQKGMTTHLAAAKSLTVELYGKEFLQAIEEEIEHINKK